MISDPIFSQRSHDGKRVEAATFAITGGLTDAEIAALHEQLPAYTGVLEHYLTLYIPVPDAEEVAAEKDVIIHSALAYLPDQDASRFIEHTPTLKGDGALVKAGTRINWDGALKRAAVDLWDREDQNPDNAPTLWEDIAYHGGYRIIPEVITATLAFSKDEIGYWPPDGLFYKAINDGTVWTPVAHAAAWEKVTIGE